MDAKQGAHLTYRPELDGLRAVAVLLVVAFHAHLGALAGGYVGVDLFFVLSGFLVTGVLLGELHDRGRVSVGGFYSRRVRRLLPAALVVVVVTALVQLLVASQPAREQMVGDARGALLYYANWHYIARSGDYFAQNLNSSPYLHFWSLSIEEQFYIAFPLVLAVLLRVSRRPALLLAGTLVVVVVASAALQVWHARSDVDYAYYATETRVYQLAAGSLLMVVLTRVGRAPGRPHRLLDRAAAPLAVVGVAGVVLVGSGLTSWSASARGLVVTAAAVAALAGLWRSPRGPASRLLGLPLPRYLGQVSYGTYLWHWPVLLVLERLFSVRPLALTFLTGVLATGLASLSYEVLERPVRRSPRLGVAGLRWPVVLTGLTASALVAVLLVPQVLDSATRPQLAVAATSAQAGTLVADLSRPVPPDLDLTAAANDVGPIWPNCTPDAPTACVIRQGSGTSVLLVGDSQARMLAGAMEKLADKEDWTLAGSVVSGCPWQDGQTNLRTEEQQASAPCQAERDRLYDGLLDQLHPDVVVVFGLARSDAYWGKNLGADSDQPVGPAGIDALQVDTSEATAHRITATGAHLVIVKSMFGTQGFGITGEDPVDCLARAKILADCAISAPIGRPAVDGAYDYLAVADPDIATVDINPIVCPEPPVCSPLQGRTVVWRDRDHVTAGYLVEHWSALLKQLKKTGFFS